MNIFFWVVLGYLAIGALIGLVYIYGMVYKCINPDQRYILTETLFGLVLCPLWLPIMTLTWIDARKKLKASGE